jgi:preprotein translocase subunit SecF
MGVLRSYYRGEANLPWSRLWRVSVIVSIVLSVGSILCLAVRELNLGIDFVGGTAWEYPSDQDVSEVRDVLEPYDLSGAKIQEVGGDTIRIQADVTDRETVGEVTAALAESADIAVNEISTTVVGPTWGDTITEKALRAAAVFFIVITGYLAIRLEWRMAIGALAAVAHDLLITVGVYSLFQFEVTPATVVAILTIMGFSLYDTVVVFDRAQENAARYASSGKLPYRSVMELSTNQVLVRSLSTTITTLLPIVIMLGVGLVSAGAAPLREFAVALAVGMIVGAYSSLFLAAPVVVALKEREPRWVQIRQRYEARLAAGRDGEPVAAARTSGPDAASSSGSVPAPSAVPAATWSANHPPRPRKGAKGKKR